MQPTRSLIVPVYRNEAFLPEVLRVVQEIGVSLDGTLEAVFVIDGSPDGSERWLLEHLPHCAVPAQLIVLSRNFGSFTAIRAGLAAARGEHAAVMAADLQEPPSLILDFFRVLAEGHDVAIGTRASRDDPWAGQFSSQLFWRAFRALVQPEMPSNGVDMFAVSRAARDALLQLNEAHSSLVAQLFWIGFPRVEVPYQRLPRKHGVSGWDLSQEGPVHLLDSIFSFTDIPIRLVTAIGFMGTVTFLVVGIALMVARFLQAVPVPGYTAIMVTILFSASLVLLALGIVGNYVWRAYENTKQRPLAIVQARTTFPGPGHG